MQRKPKPKPKPITKPVPGPAPSPAMPPNPPPAANTPPVANPQPYAGLTPMQQAQIAFMRFGLGPKASNASTLAARDGAAYEACLRELDNPAAITIPDTQVVYKWYPNKSRPNEVPKPDAVLDYANCCRFAYPKADRPLQPIPLDVMLTEVRARYAKAIEPEVGFAERLVYFWSNHFSIGQPKSGQVGATVGHFERSVIRKHALGKFSDMLKAVYQHPAMIYYLDNQYSSGPNSYYGKKILKPGTTAYNENLAREILELHTLGAYGGYKQEDVIALSMILTGWSCEYGWDSPRLGQFTFLPERHEPGAQKVLGVSYAQAGTAQGLAVFDALAKHPSTAQHIAFKLVKHFITDNPTPEQVTQLAKVFTTTDGDLKAVAKALLTVRGAWAPTKTRIIQPVPWQMSMVRGLGFPRQSVIDKAIGLFWQTLQLNQQIWGRVTPDGYPDDDYYWKNTDFIRIRKEMAWAAAILALVNDKMPIDPESLAAALLPGVRSGALVTAMDTLKKKNRYAGERLALLFSSPEYLLR